jgi:hypothetical protein
MKPVILIVCDELVSLDKLNPQYLDQLKGIQKFKNRLLNFPYHYTNSTPCSSARSVLYTGTHINVTKITENVETTWQESLGVVNPFIQTFGNYFKNSGYKTNYKGKFHITKDLVPTIPITYKPLIATQTYLESYGFDEFEKFGDFCYDRRLGTFNDELVVEQKLPIGNVPNKCDYYDLNTGYGYDGVIPFLKGAKSKELFALCVNFDNPHDVKNSNIENNISTLANVTTQIIGYNSPTIPSISDYNKNFQLFSEIPFYLEESFLLNNSFNPIANSDTNIHALVGEIALKYLFFGTEFFNINQAQQYQTAYYRVLKQVDDNLNILYDYFDSNGIFDTCIVCLTSDHGDYLGSHGLYEKGSVIYDLAYHVPLMISYPGLNKDNIIIPDNLITSHINLLPTLLTLSGIDSTKFNELKPSFMDGDGQIINSDYNVVKLSLSIAFGPFIIPALKNLDLPEVNNLIKYKANNLNYLTLQGFSVSSIVNLNNNIYNCGYYFSLLDVFSETLIHDINLIYDYYKNDIQVYILTDNRFSFGFVGFKIDLVLFLQTNTFVNLNFSQTNIELFDLSTSKYSNLIDSITINIEVYSKNNDTSVINYIKNYKPNFINDTFYIEDNSGDKIFGYLDNINFIISNNLVPKNFNTSNIKKNENVFDSLNTYIYPFTNGVQLYIQTNNIGNFKQFIKNNINNFIQKIFNRLDINNINKLLVINNPLILIIVDYIIKNNNRLVLPGYGLDIKSLIKKHFVEIFNLTLDKNEITNLADSSRVDNFISLNNDLLSILYNNIDKNNLKNIFISIPSKYFFTKEFTKFEFINNNF